MDFADIVDRIRLNLGISDEELCRSLGIGSVTLDNYLSGYVAPDTSVLQRLFSGFSVISDEEKQLPLKTEMPGSFGAEALIEKICLGKRFAVPVKDDALSEHKIFSGSFAVIELGGILENGCAVLASVNGKEPKLCIYEEDASGVRFSGEYADDYRIIGRVVYTIEKIE
ncbi:MAG: hypothetical protein J1F63_03555 [Oscillospiraceae bacterium]|nr:hypothetical protein [Oscillospiraceae bacterium]